MAITEHAQCHKGGLLLAVEQTARWDPQGTVCLCRLMSQDSLLRLFLNMTQAHSPVVFALTVPLLGVSVCLPYIKARCQSCSNHLLN